MLTLESIPIAAKEVIGRELDGETVLVMTNQAQVKVINDTGALIWASIDGARSVREIASLVCEAFEVDRAVAEQDTQDFIEQLASQGIVQIF